MMYLWLHFNMNLVGKIYDPYVTHHSFGCLHFPHKLLHLSTCFLMEGPYFDILMTLDVDIHDKTEGFCYGYGYIRQ